MEEQGSTSQSERAWAALAHGSILVSVAFVVAFVVAIRGEGTTGISVGFVSGPGLALLIWLVQKGKSAYVAGQALQALVFQLAVLVATPVVSIIWWFLWAFGDPPDWLGATLTAFPIGVLALSVLYALWGAVRCLAGHDFRYALIGKWVGRRG